MTDALERLQELVREWREGTEGHGPGVCDAAVCEICVYLQCADTLAALIERLAEEQQEQIDNAYESSACILEDVDLTDLNNEDFAARIRAKKCGTGRGKQ